MRTETRIRIVTNVNRIAFGYWDIDEEKWIEPKSTDEVIEAAGKLNCSHALVESLMMSVEDLADAIGGDLRDIWKRLDAIEVRLK